MEESVQDIRAFEPPPVPTAQSGKPQDAVAPAQSPSPHAVSEVQARSPDVAVKSPERNKALEKIHRLIHVITYPLSLAAGLWMVERDVHQSAYSNLKRYGAFNDILHEGKGGGLQPRNEKNVQQRIGDRITIEKFLEEAHATKTEYTARTTERMTHMGLGKGYSNFSRKWNYINRSGKMDALFKGATMTGIVAVALSVANSAKLIEMFTDREDGKEQSR